MKIGLASDLHREFLKPFFREPANNPIHTSKDVDVMVLAGDIDTGTRGVNWANQYYDCPVIYVPGNHEYYGHTLPTSYGKRESALDKMRKAADEHVHVLDADDPVAFIDGVRFIGCTLWAGFSLNQHLYSREVAMLHASDWMADYNEIRIEAHPDDNSRYPNRHLRPEDILNIHEHAISVLREQLAIQYTEGPTVVVTHHAPSAQSFKTKLYKEDPFSDKYATDLEYLMHKYSPVLWCHGHIHNNADYMVSNTRVLCNPHGYWSVNNHLNKINFEYEYSFSIKI